MPQGSWTAAKHYEFDDAILDAGGPVQVFRDLSGGVEFKPQGVHVDRSNNATQEALGYAYIDGYLFGENETFRKRWRVDIGRPVGLAFRAVYAAQTTARGIRLLCEA